MPRAYIDLRESLALGNVSNLNRLYVQDRRAVDRFKAAYVNRGVLDRDHLHPVQADGVGPVGGTGAENTLLSPRVVPARMYAQPVAVGSVEPGDDDQLVAGRNAVQCRKQIGVEFERGV